jgi:putative ATP-dependent endonuclease of the OLD family
MASNNLSYANPSESQPNSYLPMLTNSLISDSNHYSQIGRLMTLIESLGLPQINIGSGQSITFENIPPAYQGSGLRSVLPILAVLTSDNITSVLIDEPEIALEPLLQKKLRDLFYRSAETKRIAVSTHSHLMLNRENYDLNYVVTRDDTGVHVSRLSSERELYDITFDLLGSSLEDLFMPRNFLIVEGSSDQVIIERIMELQEIPKSRVKVVSATGIENVRNVLSTVARTLLPLVLSDSPYKHTVVALIDMPQNPTDSSYVAIKRELTNRLFELDQPSLEEYLPAVLYERCGRDKEHDLESIRRSQGYAEKNRLKKEISEQISQVLTTDDLDSLHTMVQALRTATV